ncbi:MAG: ABC transporter permease [Candidatus Marinimicrobia bacterium]|jgi:peptide/nickel transport system permease protein|nr:ABC transporter permease [Candidatus Neomarinimicrobiota bacterium]MBT3634616.1 ABC transporter permease [Candidatus Neomarinimicrobiota bacterium]MBT3682754.1 ABC transporter permease [Candidatus Neomarinimicrobiota bacterium]MBT3759591.1 ABC transporter permease [Candidatus Neomarinimicrobiota bacterium]MBT3894537.1 ABC transporter permease [Candidatus Neomarinimicrobiota bacterium]
MTPNKSRSYFQIVKLQYKKNKLAMAGFFMVIFLFTIAIFADFIANDKPLLCKYNDNYYSPVVKEYFVEMGITKWQKDFLNIEWKELEYEMVIWPPIPYLPTNLDFYSRFTGPGKNGHYLGTDQLGRDVLSGMIHGTRIALLVGFVSMSIAITIGVILGSLAGFMGGITDIIIQRMIEVMITIPTFFLIITVVAFYPHGGIWMIMVVIGMTGWTAIARFTRAEFLKTRNQDYVTAAVALGYSNIRTIFKHVLPNAIAPVMVSAAFGIASAILIESSLSFLGFGVSATTVSWGSILSVARGATYAWWLALFPGFAIFISVTTYNLVGEGLRDALDPRLK